ncbi:hypothetical protein [Polyangium sorediatum]|uniref:Uncharacterized protein n=1 Tax=Polyangium sorediatum TaxID=889274 RepID=A0ABT6NZF9_9BACT|nr:hypothetical protein [Polyangium sorediatum]MDI1433689.1 hypothetical protein [Polyangium sorediatum]
MSLDYYFHVETRRSGDWTVPEGFPCSPYRSEPLGEFTWLRGRSPRARLFWGPSAIFPFQPGPPESRARSALFRSLGPDYDFEENERRICWIPYGDLMVDLWDDMQLVLQCNVGSRDAALFGDGRMPFPEDALRARGHGDFEIDGLQEGEIVNAPIDRTQGKRRFEIEVLAPEVRVPVTFVASVRAYLGESRATAFRDLRAHGREDELRVVSMVG